MGNCRSFHVLCSLPGIDTAVDGAGRFSTCISTLQLTSSIIAVQPSSCSQIAHLFAWFATLTVQHAFRPSDMSSLVLITNKIILL